MGEGGGTDKPPAAGAADGVGSDKQQSGDDSKRYRGRRNRPRANKPWKESNPPAHVPKEKFVG